MLILDYTTPQNTSAKIHISQFKALDGWEIQARYTAFCASHPSKDKAFRRDFTMEILSYVRVVKGDQEYEMKTDALIDNHLGTWENIEMVFKETLKHNGIDPETHANRTNHWAEAGAELAIGFIAEASKLMGPAFGMVAEQNKPE